MSEGEAAARWIERACTTLEIMLDGGVPPSWSRELLTTKPCTGYLATFGPPAPPPSDAERALIEALEEEHTRLLAEWEAGRAGGRRLADELREVAWACRTAARELRGLPALRAALREGAAP